MGYYDYPAHGMDSGWGILMMLVWLVVLGLLVAVALKYLRGDTSNPTAHTDPLDIIKERYARGEIDRAQYEALRKDLSSK